jgi:hypothetical protein
MRHSGCRTTLDIYTRAVDSQKREASLKVGELMLPLDIKKFSAPFRTLGRAEGNSPVRANNC